MQWLQRISSRVPLQEFPHLRKKFWGRHSWASGYLAVSSGTITDEMIREYIDEQEGEQIIWLCVSIDLGKYARKTLHVSAPSRHASASSTRTPSIAGGKRVLR